MAALPKVYHVTTLPGEFHSEHHRQDDSDDCGRACAQTILRSFDSTEFPQQWDLEDKLSDYCSGAPKGTPLDRWGANPGCLERELSTEAGNLTRKRTLKLITCNTEAIASQCLVRSLDSGGISSVALVNGKAHWVTVYGCDLDTDPGDYADPITRYDIRAFYVHDPAPNVWRIKDGQIVETVDPDECHTDGDKCGQGMFEKEDDLSNGGLGVLDNPTYENWGLAYRRIRYDHWRKMVFTGIPEGGTRHDDWVKKYLAIVDVTDPFGEHAYVDLCQLGDPAGGMMPVGCADTEKPDWSDHMSSFTDDLVRDIQDIVKKGLEADGLIPYAPRRYKVNNVSRSWRRAWRRLLKGTNPSWVHPVGPPDEPGYKGPNFYYYLVEMQAEDGTVPAVVMVSACKGNEQVLEMAAIEKGGTIAIKFAPPKVYHAASTDPNARKLEIPLQSLGIPTSSSHLLKITNGRIPPPSEFRLVWGPVRGGLSPYAPFYKFYIKFDLPVSGSIRTFRVPHFIRADFWNWEELFLDARQIDNPIKTEIFRKFQPM
jgi:hypothetical protein